MRKAFITAAVLLGVLASVMAQTNDYSIRDVRDPVKLKAALNDDMLATDTRLDVIEALAIGGALAPASVIIGNASTVAVAQAVSGAITITTNGVTSIAANAVTGAKIADGTVSNADIAVEGFYGGAAGLTNTILGTNVLTLITVKGRILGLTIE